MPHQAVTGNFNGTVYAYSGDDPCWRNGTSIDQCRISNICDLCDSLRGIRRIRERNAIVSNLVVPLYCDHYSGSDVVELRNRSDGSMACVLDRRRIDGDHLYVSISALQSILTQGIIFSK